MLPAATDTASCPPPSARPVHQPGRLVCACLQITERQLLDALSATPIRSLRDLRRTLGAGDGCTACHPVLRRYLDGDRQPSCPPICSDR